MFVERGTPVRHFLSHGKEQAPDNACQTRERSFFGRMQKVYVLSVCLPAVLIGLGAGSSLNLAYGQGESNAVVSSARVASDEVGVSDQLHAGSLAEQGTGSNRKSLRERSEPTVTGAAMHVALFVPRN